jgi:NADH-quinone oxidoreductase subunit N
VYETASPWSAAYLAGSLKIALFGTLAAIVTPIAAVQVTSAGGFGDLVYQVFGFVGVLAAISIVVGSTVALQTPSYRRMLGYAGVAQVGYAFVALAALNPSGALFFMATYAVGTTAAFIGAEVFSRLDPTWNGTISGLAGRGRRHPVMAGAVSVSLMSLAGLPPLLGFWGKFQAFGSAIRSGAVFLAQGQSAFGWSLVGLTAVGVIGSVVSLAYYGSVVRALFLDPAESEDPGAEGSTAPPSALVGTLIGLTLLLIILGALPLLTGVAPLVRAFLPS